jgi:glycosyltransferase involved in cell wall biosynthesis
MMTRIALVSPFVLPVSCGNSIFAERLRAGLAASGCDVALFDCRPGSLDRVRQFDPHLLHSINAERPRQWIREFFQQGKRIPWVITLTGTDYNTWCGVADPPPQLVESFTQADALVVFHEDALQTVSRCLPFAAGKILVIAQGVSPAGVVSDRQTVRQRYGLRSDAVIFLMVAGIRPVKNITAAISAFQTVEQEVTEAALVLVGPVIDQREAEQVFSLGGTLRRFCYLGELPPPVVRELMGAADVLVNTSLHEGMPGAVLEAMAAGLPVIASAVAGNRALVRDNENGLLYSGDNPGEFINAAVRLAADNALRACLGAAGREKTAACFSVEQELENYQRLYRSLLG